MKSLYVIYIELKQNFIYLFENIIIFSRGIIFAIIQFGLLKFIKMGSNNFIFKNNFEIALYVIGILIINELSFTDVHKLIENEYKRGDIVLTFTKPYSPIKYYFFSGFANIITNLIIKVLPLLLILFILSKGQLNLLNLSIFLIDALLLGIINVLLYIIIGFTGYFTFYNNGIVLIFLFIKRLFSGQLLPIDLFPLWFVKIANYLPFKYLIYQPVIGFLFSNKLIKTKFINILIPQFIILLTLIFSVFLIFNKIRKKVYVYG